MKANELLDQCVNFTNKYFSENLDEMRKSILGGVNETDSLNDAVWKIAIDTAMFSCKTSVLLTISFLASQGLIDVDPEDIPPLRLL